MVRHVAAGRITGIVYWQSAYYMHIGKPELRAHAEAEAEARRGTVVIAAVIAIAAAVAAAVTITIVAIVVTAIGLIIITDEDGRVMLIHQILLEPLPKPAPSPRHSSSVKVALPRRRAPRRPLRRRRQEAGKLT
jgi:hypothetical protein